MQLIYLLLSQCLPDKTFPSCRTRTCNSFVDHNALALLIIRPIGDTQKSKFSPSDIFEFCLTDVFVFAVFRDNSGGFRYLRSIVFFGEWMTLQIQLRTALTRWSKTSICEPFTLLVSDPTVSLPAVAMRMRRQRGKVE